LLLRRSYGLRGVLCLLGSGARGLTHNGYFFSYFLRSLFNNFGRFFKSLNKCFYSFASRFYPDRYVTGSVLSYVGNLYRQALTSLQETGKVRVAVQCAHIVKDSRLIAVCASLHGGTP
jgi:hypothetical protein